MVEVLSLIMSSEVVCNGCLVGKHPERRYEFGKKRRVASTLDLVHSDVFKTMPTTSMTGSKYFMNFIDDYSRYCWIYFLKHKYEVFETFKVFNSLVENTLGKKIKELILEYGGRLLSYRMHVAISFKDLFFLSTTPFCCGVYGTQCCI